MSRLLPVVLAAAVLSFVLAGCGDDDTPDTPGGQTGSWSVDGEPADVTQPVWATGSTVHIGDASIDTEQPIERYVVAGDGVYFVPAGSDDDELMHAGPDGVESTGAYADPETLRASPDGRHLAFVDRVTGDDDTFGTPVALAVVVDLEAGEETVRSSDGMGDLDTDLADLYEDAGDPDVLGVSDETAWFFTPADIRAYDLTSGKGSTIPDDATGDTTQPWYVERYRGEGRWNPSHTWAIADTATRDRFVSADGARVQPTTGAPTWSLFRWLDDSTAMGLSVDAPPTAEGTIDPDADATLITCTVPDGGCNSIPASTGTDFLLPNDSLR